MAICKQITISAPLVVTGLSLWEAETGVVAQVVIEGDGSGTLQVTWGTVNTTTYAVTGSVNVEQAMPPGTHTICVEMV